MNWSDVWPVLVAFGLGLLAMGLLGARNAYDLGWYRGYERGRIDRSILGAAQRQGTPPDDRHGT